MPRPVLAAAALVAFLVAPLASAEYLVLRDGRAMKVASYRFEGDTTIVELPGGGAMRFGSDIVSHVAPDEDLVVPVAVAAAAAPSGPLAEAGWESFADPRYVEPIQRIAHSHDVDPALVAAMIKVESDFHPHAVSPKGAKGLMQLMPATAREHGVADPFDPEANILGGVVHLSGLLDRYQGDLPLALAAYNAGQRAVDRAGGIPAIAETRKYVERVLAIARRASDVLD